MSNNGDLSQRSNRLLQQDIGQLRDKPVCSPLEDQRFSRNMIGICAGQGYIMEWGTWCERFSDKVQRTASQW